jgi:hypothetical protein
MGQPPDGESGGVGGGLSGLGGGAGCGAVRLVGAAGFAPSGGAIGSA